MEEVVWYTLCESTYTVQVDKGKCWSMRTPLLYNITVSPNSMEKGLFFFFFLKKAYSEQRQNSIKAVWTHMRTSWINKHWYNWNCSKMFVWYWNQNTTLCQRPNSRKRSQSDGYRHINSAGGLEQHGSCFYKSIMFSLTYRRNTWIRKTRQ